MATNISYVLKHKSKFFDTFLNDLQTVSKEYQKRLKKVGILRVNGECQVRTSPPAFFFHLTSDLSKIQFPLN